VSFRRCWIAAVVVTVAFLAPPSAMAGRSPEDVFRGQVITSKKRIPTSDKSASAYISRIKAAKTTRFVEDKAKGEWKIYYAAFFRRPLNDLEVTVRLFDVTGGGKKLINSFEQYLDGRGASSVISSFVLERKFVGVNKQILVLIESRGTILSTGKFAVLGEGEKFDGKVDFSEDEAKNGAAE
jgi:hypothetical protein